MARPISDEARAILGVLERLPEGQGLPVRELARSVQIPIQRARMTVHRMAGRGEVVPVAVERLPHACRPVTKYAKAPDVEAERVDRAEAMRSLDQVMRVGIVKL